MDKEFLLLHLAQLEQEILDPPYAQQELDDSVEFLYKLAVVYVDRLDDRLDSPIQIYTPFLS